MAVHKLVLCHASLNTVRLYSISIVSKLIYFSNRMFCNACQILAVPSPDPMRAGWHRAQLLVAQRAGALRTCAARDRTARACSCSSCAGGGPRGRHRGRRARGGASAAASAGGVRARAAERAAAGGLRLAAAATA